MSDDIIEIRKCVLRREITRLCHFTPSRKLSHIASGQVGILSSEHLEEFERNIFDPTDLERFDNHKECVCCSIEYPNVWYFDKARENSKFKDLFGDCSVNAAKGHGYYISEGYRTFEALFAEHPTGSKETRQANHLDCCPTDDQAEILVPDRIKIEDIVAVGVRDEKQAKNEAVRLKYAQIIPIPFKFIIAPHFYKKRLLSRRIREGVRPKEKLFRGGQDD